MYRRKSQYGFNPNYYVQHEEGVDPRASGEITAHSNAEQKSGWFLVTITLSPEYYHLSKHEQLRKSLKKLSSVLIFNADHFFIVYELTKAENIHYHIILCTDNIDKIDWKQKYLGFTDTKPLKSLKDISNAKAYLLKDWIKSQVELKNTLESRAITNHIRIDALISELKHKNDKLKRKRAHSAPTGVIQTHYADDAEI